MLKSKVVKLIQFSNILDIFSTFEVLKLFIINDSKFVQLLNILFISVTEDVLKLLKFNEIKELQPENI